MSKVSGIITSVQKFNINSNWEWFYQELKARPSVLVEIRQDIVWLGALRPAINLPVHNGNWFSLGPHGVSLMAKQYIEWFNETVQEDTVYEVGLAHGISSVT